MLLGPILPILTYRWHLDDSQSGLLLLAQFCGATLGGITVSSRLRTGLLTGLISAAIGFMGFALAPGLSLACVALFIGGFGVGRTIAAINIIVGERYTVQRAAALSRLNFSWSFGALLSPLLAAWLIPRHALAHILATFAALFVVVTAAFTLQLARHPASPSLTPASKLTAELSGRHFVYFAALLFVYGGLETCLSGWLTTDAMRSSGSSLVRSEYIMVLLLIGLTIGRALAAWLLLRIRDVTLLRLSLLIAATLIAALASAHQWIVIAVLATLLGITLAPIFPTTFALTMAHRPSVRQAGTILAASGLGAAALPWFMGILSTRTGSLHIALTIPIAAALLMLFLSLHLPATPSVPTFPEPSASV